MSLIYRLLFCLLALPTLASAQSLQGEGRASLEHFDCLINPDASGLVACLPPEHYGTMEYQWDMGDGNYYVTDQGQPHIYHTYREPGEYTVTLTVNHPEVSTTVQHVLSIPEPREGDDTSNRLAGNDFR